MLKREKLSHCTSFRSRICHWFQLWIYSQEILSFVDLGDNQIPGKQLIETVLLLLDVQKDCERALENPQPPLKKWKSCQSGWENYKLPVNISNISERRETLPHCRCSQQRKGTGVWRTTSKWSVKRNGFRAKEKKINIKKERANL